MFDPWPKQQSPRRIWIPFLLLLLVILSLAYFVLAGADLRLQDDAGNAQRTQAYGDGAQQDVDGCDQPEGEEIQTLVAVLSVLFHWIVVRLELFIHPHGSYDEPSEHEAVEQSLRGRLPEMLLFALLLAFPDSRG